eukprot:jgi/Tetstr1/458632/TSEL_045035.t1
MLRLCAVCRPHAAAVRSGRLRIDSAIRKAFLSRLTSFNSKDIKNIGDMPKGMDILSASCKVRRYRGKAPNFLMKRHLRNLRKNTPLHKLLREVMLLNEQWEEARTAHADARTSMNPQLATNFAKTVIPAVNDKLRSNLTNYVLNEALKQVQASAIYGVALCSMKQDRPCVPSGHTIELERGADLAGLPRFSSITEALADLHLTSAASAAHALYVIYTKCTINNGR